MLHSELQTTFIQRNYTMYDHIVRPTERDLTGIPQESNPGALPLMTECVCMLRHIESTASIPLMKLRVQENYDVLLTT